MQEFGQFAVLQATAEKAHNEIQIMEITTNYLPGIYNDLEIANIEAHGAYLRDGTGNQVFLPAKWVPKGGKSGDLIRVFVYFDSEDRPIATTMQPAAIVGEVAFLEVADVNQAGAFLNWGLEKDLLLPFGEQKLRLEPGQKVLVYVFRDPQTGRIAATARIEKFLENDTHTFKEGQEVQIILWEKTELGYKAIIENRAVGLIYANEVFEILRKGMKKTAYIAKLRDDGKIDLRLLPPGYDKIAGLAEIILSKLKAGKGFLPLNDHSDAEEIYENLGMSKKNFKKACGLLYKNRQIILTEKGIRLIKK